MQSVAEHLYTGQGPEVFGAPEPQPISGALAAYTIEELPTDANAVVTGQLDYGDLADKHAKVLDKV